MTIPAPWADLHPRGQDGHLPSLPGWMHLLMQQQAVLVGQLAAFEAIPVGPIPLVAV